MASVATRSYSAALRCSSLSSFENSVVRKENGPSWRGRELGPSFPRTKSAEMRPAFAISDHKSRMASVRFPTINQKNPHYPQPGTEPRRLMFEDIPRSAPTPKKKRRHGPFKEKLAGVNRRARRGRHFQPTLRFSAEVLPRFSISS
jgi:hypothetical protein